MTFPARTRRWIPGGCLALVCVVLTSAAIAEEIVTLDTGVKVRGRRAKIGGLSADPLSPLGATGGADLKQVVLVDDELRRVFFPSSREASVVPAPPTSTERIEVAQRVPSQGRRITAVGSILRVTPFDAWGRRIFTMNTSRGPLDVIQGITEVSPRSVTVEGLSSDNPYIWKMKLATGSIPRETLTGILTRAIDQSDPEERLRVVRLYTDAERYRDARRELERTLEDFPELAELRDYVRSLNQLEAKRLIAEIKLRGDAGQHQLATTMLQRFPTKGVAGTTLLEVRELLAQYERRDGQRKQVIELLETHRQAVADEALREQLAGICGEISKELNLNTLNRMADYLRLADAKTLKAEQKLALAISGWLLGSGAGEENLAIAASLPRVRDAVASYLASQRQHERDQLLKDMATMEGGSPQYVARILRSMKPPGNGQPLEPGEVPGMYLLKTPGLSGEPEVQYLIQLPPEYDPYRKYPCIVTLNGAGTSPQLQLDWWAGASQSKAPMRLGQATRHGYIVLAPLWTVEHQRQYEYSAREHAAVLFSLQDAMKRFNIDSDQVFLSGHSMGGDAAWDIGLAHPDLWAGVIPIVARADKYVARYWENGRDLPMYFVGGDMDGERLKENSRDLDRYLTKAGYDVMVVHYQGRGHEHFQDEIQHLFAWMNVHRRRFDIKEFECVTMRPWDNFFWFVELDAFPTRSLVLPLAWPGTKVRLATTSASVLANNSVVVRSAADQVKVWLTPDIVDFGKPIRVSINGRRAEVSEPSVATMLDDVAARGDRQHPFWAYAEK